MKAYKILLTSLSLMIASATFADDSAVFKKKCGMCHAVEGLTKAKTGPDLTGFVSKRPAGYIQAYVQNPAKARKDYPEIYAKEVKGKFSASMSAVKLSEDEIKSILNVLK